MFCCLYLLHFCLNCPLTLLLRPPLFFLPCSNCWRVSHISGAVHTRQLRSSYDHSPQQRQSRKNNNWVLQVGLRARTIIMSIGRNLVIGRDKCLLWRVICISIGVYCGGWNTVFKGLDSIPPRQDTDTFAVTTIPDAAMCRGPDNNS